MTTVLLALLLAGMQKDPTAPLWDAQRSHIEANVPAPADFDRFLRRDLEAYFRSRRGGSAQIKFEMLREGATQSGVSYPKFYVWAQVLGGDVVLEQGAVRVAAVERREFQVTDYLTATSLQADPSGMHKVFPAAVRERIKAKLNAVR